MINTNTVSTRREESSIISVRKMCVVALAIVLNVIGGQIALMLHLPIYLDSIGTIMIAMLYGPVYGMLPPLLYGLVMGFTLDIYSLYFMPVGLMLGLMTGLVSRYFSLKKWRMIPGAMLITIPGTIVSSVITAVLFGGITSSGSTVIVQVLNKAGLDLTASVFIVQILTDYLDRLLSLVVVSYLLHVIPSDLYRTEN
ncbi:MAG: ECF transporter S component [Lachnospiraceae bacterium]|nr:ECF transporter S component [Lachnospiraceae bacterium]